MNIDKQFWKTIYYWIRYLNFDIVSREKDDQEIWLAHKRKCISINSDRAREIQALRYMNDYLLDEVVKTKG
ncbi:DUF1514 family protein, partial [Staphylococcus aureus]